MKLLFNYLSNRILNHFSSNIEVKFSQKWINPSDNYEIYFHQLDPQSYKQLVRYIRKYVSMVSDEPYLSKHRFIYLIQDEINQDFLVLQQLLWNSVKLEFEEFDLVDSLYQIVNFQHNIKHYPLRFFYRKQFALYKGKLLWVLWKSLFWIYQESKYFRTEAFCQYKMDDVLMDAEQDYPEYAKDELSRDLPSPSQIVWSVFCESEEFSPKVSKLSSPKMELSRKRSRDYKSYFTSFFNFTKYAFGAWIVLVSMFVFFQLMNNSQESNYLVEPGDLIQPSDSWDDDEFVPVDVQSCKFEKDYSLIETDKYLVWYDKQDFVIGKIDFDEKDNCSIIEDKIQWSIHYSLTVPKLIKDNPNHSKLTNLTLDNDNILFTLNIRNQDYLYENGNLLYFFQDWLAKSFPDKNMVAITNSRYLFAKKVLISSLEKFSADVGMYEKWISPIDQRFDWKYMLSLGLILLLFMFSIAVVFLRDNFIKRLFEKAWNLISSSYWFIFSQHNLYFSFGKIIGLFASLGLSILLLTSLMRFSLFSMITVLIVSYILVFFYYYIIRVNNIIISQISHLKKFYDILPAYYEMKSLIDSTNSSKDNTISSTKSQFRKL